KRNGQGIPPGLASWWSRVGDHGLQHDQPLPRQPPALLPRQAEEHAGRRQQSPREDNDRVRIADGRWQPAQPSSRPAHSSWTWERHAWWQPAPEGAGRDADGERVPVADAQDGTDADEELR